MDVGGGGDELGGFGGANVEQGGGGFGDGVDGGAAGDMARIDRCERIIGDFEGGNLGQGSAEEKDWVRGSGVGPGVAAGAGDGDAKAEAAEGSSDDGGVAAAIKGDSGGDAVAVGAALEEVTHAAEVAFAFFAYVGGEEDGDGWNDVGVTQGCGYGEESGQAGGVVADAWCLDYGGVFLFDGVDLGFDGEDCVEMGGEEDDWGDRGWFGLGRIKSEMRGSFAPLRMTTSLGQFRR